MVKTPSVLNAFQAGAPAPSESGVKRRKLCQWHNAGVIFLPLHFISWRDGFACLGSLRCAERCPEPMAHYKPRAQRGRRGHETTYALEGRCAAVLAPSVSLRRPVAPDRDCHRRSAVCWRPLHIETRIPPPRWYSIKNGRTTLFILPEGPMTDTMGPVAHKSGGHWRGSRSSQRLPSLSMDAGRDSSPDALLVWSLGPRAERPPRPVSTETQLHPAASHPARSIRRDNGYDVVGTATCDHATRDTRVKGAPVLAVAEKHPMALLQPFSQKSRTPTVAKEFQIGLCGVVEADLELSCDSWSAGFLGERLCARGSRCCPRCRPRGLRRPPASPPHPALSSRKWG